MELSPIIINHVHYTVVQPISADEHPYAIAADHDRWYAFPNGLEIAAEVETADGLKIPVTTIRSMAFAGCKAQVVSIPPSVTLISANAFQCSDIREVNGAEGVKVIAHNAFSDTRSLQRYPFCNGLVAIESEAFANSNLTNVWLPDTLAEINTDSFSFSDDLYLNALSLPAGVCIQPSAHRGGFRARHMWLRGDSPDYAMTGRMMLLTTNNTVLWVAPPDDCGFDEISIPAYVKKLPGKTLPYCDVALLEFGSAQKPTLPGSVYVVDAEYAECKIKFYGEGSLSLENCGDVEVDFTHPYPSVEIDGCENVVLRFEVAPAFLFFKDLLSMRLETLAVHYADDVDRVHMILMGENVFGADTKVIDKIQELESEAMLTLVHDAYPYEFSYSVDFTRCKRIPDLLCPDFNSMKHMALRVPEGMVDAYASHPVWCMAAYITDKVSCVDQCVRPGVAAKKNKMKYAMAKAAVDAMAYSNLQVHPAFSEDNVNFEIEQPLDLGKVWNATVCITGRTMPCSDIDCWEKLCGRLGELKRFISGEIDELP